MGKRGITLVETLIASLIFVFLISAIYAVFSSGRSARDSIDVQAELSRNARTAMQDMVRTLSESNAATITVDAGALPSFTDPLNGEEHRVLIFASARGDPAVAAEDGTHLNNNYVHLGANYKPAWRSAVVYCTYIENGVLQLCKYIDYGPATAYYAAAGLFPITYLSIDATTINLRRGDGSVFTLARNSGRVMANYIASEDANNDGVLDPEEDDGNANMPPDNQDGVLDRGADMTLTGRLLKVKLFLVKSQTVLTPGVRFLTETLDGSTEVRNE